MVLRARGVLRGWKLRICVGRFVERRSISFFVGRVRWHIRCGPVGSGLERERPLHKTMSARWTDQDLADYRARRGGKVEPCANVKIDRSVAHDYKADFVQQLDLVGINVEPEFFFALPRKYRADWRVKDTRILIEYEGGLFKKRASGHLSISGVIDDIERINLATLLGWIVIRITPKHVVSGQALLWVEEALVYC